MRRKIVLWGIGRRAEAAIEFLDCLGLDLVASIDSNEKYQGTLWHGAPVLSFDEYLAMDNQPVIIVTPRRLKEIIKILVDAGIEHFILLDDIIVGNQQTLNEYDNINSKQQIDRLDILAYIYYQNWKKERELCHRFFHRYILSGSKAGVKSGTLQKIINAKHLVIHDVSIAHIMKCITGKQPSLIRYKSLPSATDCHIFQGSGIYYLAEKAALDAVDKGIDIVFAEDGFIHSIEPTTGTSEKKYAFRHSAVFDEDGLYLNANAPSRMENILNSEWKLEEKEYNRAKKLIDIIRKEKLSKYNCQPLGKKLKGTKRQKVLVIDQVYGDKSIGLGMADDENTFREMLEAAKAENPDADIYIKIHPDVSKGHFAWVKENERLHLLSEPMNPVELLEQVDKVYVVSSQMGFEAAMCGLEVHNFGMPFYAGWGITHDRLKCERRKKKRSVLEVFYAAYILSTTYISHKTNDIAELEDVIEELLELRDEYFRRR